MLSATVLICYLIAVMLIWKREHRPEPDEPEEPEAWDAMELKPEADRLINELRHLEELDRMLLDLRLCPENYQRVFRMEWQGAAGGNHAIDFLTDGQDLSAEYLTELAEAERDQVNESCIRLLRTIEFRMNLLDAESKAESQTTAEGERSEDRCY